MFIIKIKFKNKYKDQNCITFAPSFASHAVLPPGTRQLSISLYASHAGNSKTTLILCFADVIGLPMYVPFEIETAILNWFQENILVGVIELKSAQYTVYPSTLLSLFYLILKILSSYYQ